MKKSFCILITSALIFCALFAVVACAAVAACVLNGLTERSVTVHVLGGELQIEWDENTGEIFMTGPAETVFEGQVEWL